MRRTKPRGSPAGLLPVAAVGAGATAIGAAALLLQGSGGTLGAATSSVIFAAKIDPKMMVAAEIVTHIIAFLIFIWVLRKFAWGPILKVIDERRDKIEGDFKKAEELAKKAEETQAKFETQLKDIEDKAREKMQEAIDEGKRIAADIQQKAREDAEALLERAKQNADIELANAKKALRQDVVTLVLATTEKVLRETVDKTAQQKHVDKFIDELGGLS